MSGQIRRFIASRWPERNEPTLTGWRPLLDELSLAPAQSSNPFSSAATLVWNLTASITGAEAGQNFSREYCCTVHPI